VSDAQIQDRAELIRSRISSAAQRAGRDASAVSLLPITKGHPPDVIEAVVAAGFRSVGENRVTEAEEKRRILAGLELEWCMVGHVQRNKASRVVQTFDRVESLDSLRLARRLAQEAEKLGARDLPVLVQVNASGEASKGGLDLGTGT
jgi:pyridoxal phosphate enzyme (YggS family)